MNGKNEDDPFRMKSITPEEDKPEESYETVIHHNTTGKKGFWSESTPAPCKNISNFSSSSSLERVLETVSFLERRLHTFSK